MNNKIIFIVTSYNCEPYIERCINSLIQQGDQDFGIIFIDDASTDITVELINQNLHLLPNSIVHVNESRTGSSAFNQMTVVKEYVTNPNSWICILDGDDRLIDSSVVKQLKKIRGLGENIYFAFSLYEETIRRHSQTEQNIKREDCPYHLRMFRAWLYYAVDESNYYKDGELIREASDIAFIYPVIDLCENHIRFIPHFLYHWNNNLTYHNDHHLNLNAQMSNLEYVKNRPELSRLSSSQIETFKNQMIK